MKQAKIISKIAPELIKEIELDLLICSSGYESRASFLVENYTLNTQHKIALLFDDQIDKYSRTRNDEIFSKNGFKLIKASGDSGDELLKVLESLSFNGKEKINVMIDYSSMTRVWYATILNYYYFRSVPFKEVTMLFAYSGALFNAPPEEVVPNINVGPIPGYSHLTISNKPTILIFGLGYEKDRAYGLTEYLDAETYLFYTSSKNNNMFSSYVENNNSDLIKSVTEDRIFMYDFEDIEYTYFVLFNLCEKLSKSNRIVLAPCGPKPFTLLCLIVGHILPNVDVWRISPGKKSIPIDRKPDGKVLIFKTQLYNADF